MTFRTCVLTAAVKYVCMHSLFMQSDDAAICCWALFDSLIFCFIIFRTYSVKNSLCIPPSSSYSLNQSINQSIWNGLINYSTNQSICLTYVYTWQHILSQLMNFWICLSSFASSSSHTPSLSLSHSLEPTFLYKSCRYTYIDTSMIWICSSNHLSDSLIWTRQAVH